MGMHLLPLPNPCSQRFHTLGCWRSHKCTGIHQEHLLLKLWQLLLRIRHEQWIWRWRRRQWSRVFQPHSLEDLLLPSLGHRVVIAMSHKFPGSGGLCFGSRWVEIRERRIPAFDSIRTSAQTLGLGGSFLQCEGNCKVMRIFANCSEFAKQRTEADGIGNATLTCVAVIGHSFG